MPRNLIAAVLFAGCLAWLLSLIPTTLWHNENIPTFRPTEAIELREHNLVDLFTMMPTHYNIKRVKWENRSLYVDMVVPSFHSVDLSTLYQDFYTLAYHSLSGTRNVEHLYFRLLEQAGTEPLKLLIAISADRDKGSTLPPPGQIPDIRSFVENTFPIKRQVN